MVISWLGEAGLRIQTKDAVLVIDPPAASTGMKPARSAADIVAISTNDQRDAKAVGGTPFLINSPGEYEVKNVFVYGLVLPSHQGFIHFRVEVEDLSLGHIADLSQKLENGEVGLLEGVDILCLPVGGKSVLDAEAAAALISQIEPRIVIPIQYKIPKSTSGYLELAPFLKEIGAKNTDPQQKFKVAKKDLPAEDTQVVVLAHE
jgi:L-ascorbate metabolism protein UlaG (beta-lactamase superfamily)